ncbi:hypothetical protein [Parvibaculum sp. MBR-TMA-1.3b-4.2]|jgi:chromosome segregation ATPase
MIESLMLFALGFLIATLFAIIASQFIWRRAVTVTTRNLAGTDPAGEEHDALRDMLNDRNARLTELSSRLEKLEAQETNEPSSFPGTDGVEEQQRQSETEAAETEAETAREMERLRARLTELEAELARSQAERQAQDDHLAAMNQRIADFEAALSQNDHRKEQSQASLRHIGERAARLAYDLNNIVEEIAPRDKPRKAPEEASEEAPKEEPEETAKAETGDEAEEKTGETPEDGQQGAPQGDGVADTLEELTDRVQTAYGTPSEGPSAALPASAENPMDDNGEKHAGKPGASPLDERIRALEAGLPH